jgi:L-erythro-3,5-diaminohexanoate dehydrogenase
VLEPAGVLPQAAWRLDARSELWPDEVRIRVDRLNLDAASFRQLSDKHAGDGDAVRAEVVEIIRTRGKMHNPVTGSGGMLVGTVAEVGPLSPLGLAPGDRIATLVSLTLTPLQVTDGLADWDGRSEQVPCEGHAVLFGRSIAAHLPPDLPAELALAVMDVCGAPALTHRVVARYVAQGRPPVVEALVAAGLADQVVLADARDPVALAEAVTRAGGPADVTVVCVDVPGCEHGAVLSTANLGTVVFFSMATSFAAAALGAEGLAADVTLMIGNGYAAGHADFALDVLRGSAGARALFEARLAAHAETRAEAAHLPH